MDRAYIKYISALIIFGLNGVIASMAATKSYETVFVRTFTGSLFLFCLLLVLKERPVFKNGAKGVLYTSISGAAMGGSWMALFEAYNIIGVGVSSLLYYCGPVIVMALSPFIFNEKLVLNKLIGFAAVLAGAILANSGTENGLNIWGVFCGAVSAVMYSFMVIFNKKAENVNGISGPLLQLFTAFLTVFIFVFLKGGLPFYIPKGSFMPLIVLGVFNTGFGCYLYFSSIGSLKVQTVAICGYLEPLSALLFSILFLNENISPLQLLGAALILGGAFYAEFFKKITNRLYNRPFLNKSP